MRTLLFIATLALLFISCGEHHKAKNTIETFLDEYLVAEEYYVDLQGVDSTWRVGDSALVAMRHQATESGRWKEGLTFSERDASGKLVYMRGKVIAGKDTFMQTFYLNPDLTGVVAIKDN